MAWVRTVRQPHLAGPLPPRRRHHRRASTASPPRPRPPSTPTAWNPTRREGRFLDPAAGKITLAEWSQDWLHALDVAIRTEDVYRSLLRLPHPAPLGRHRLVDISGIKAAAWAKDCAPLLADHRYGDVKLLSLLLADAAEERLIAANPIRAQRRGRRRTERRSERLWATPAEVLAIARQRRPASPRRTRPRRS